MTAAVVITGEVSAKPMEALVDNVAALWVWVEA